MIHNVSAISGSERPSSAIFRLAALDCLEQENHSQEDSDARAEIPTRFRDQVIVTPEHLSAEESWASEGPYQRTEVVLPSVVSNRSKKCQATATLLTRRGPRL